MSMLSLFRPCEDLPPDFMLIMYGMRRAGKTTMLMHMLQNMADRFKLSQVHVFSGTADENPAQWKYFPPGFVVADIANIDVHIGDILRQQQEQIRDEVKNQVLQKRIRMDGISIKRKRGVATFTNARKLGVHPLVAEPAVQNDTTKYEKDEYASVSCGDEVVDLTDSQINDLRRAGKIDESRFPRRLIILDDVVNDNSVRHSSNLNKLAVSGRHIFISCIILSQCVTGSGSVPPIIRRNCDYIAVVGYPRSVNERKMLAEEYLTIGNESDAKEKSLRVLKDITQKPYRAFIINCTNSTATEFNQFLFQYGPVPPPPRHVSPSFKLGTPAQWSYQLHHGDREAQFSAEQKPKKPTNPKTDGRFRGANDPRNRVIPVFRTQDNSESNPNRVREYFNPIF